MANKCNYGPTRKTGHHQRVHLLHIHQKLHGIKLQIATANSTYTRIQT